LILNSNDIEKIIPHRHPFLLVDRIIELEVNKRAVGLKAVTVNEPFFRGHFPDYHVMPGVLIIEALAQVGAVALLSSEEHKGKLAFFAGIKEAKFKRQVIPGDVLRLETEIVKVRGSIGIGEAKAYVGDQLACSATLTFALGKKDA
jgi:3-hydroxyacyl-[acyl-carrier-protein] dehydratase